MRWSQNALCSIAVVLLVAVCLQTRSLTHANEIFRPRTVGEIPDPKSETAFRVKGARVAYINEVALKRDFPELSQLHRSQLEAWVLENFAYISENQLSLSSIRASEIPVDLNDVKRAYRPERYNRAALVDAISPAQKPIGLVDIKGFGHGDRAAIQDQVKSFVEAQGDQAKIDEIRLRDHSDGMMSFGEAVAELTRQAAAQMLFDMHNRAHGTRLETVESYFIIELPFSILKDKGQAIRAALYGRQAHWGRDSGLEVPKKIYVDPFGQNQRSWLNAAVDFGGVLISDPRVARNYSVPEGGDPSNPQQSRAWAWGHEVARAFSHGDIDAVYRHLREMTGPLLDEWKSAAQSKPASPRGIDRTERMGQAIIKLRDPKVNPEEKAKAAHYVLVESTFNTGSLAKQRLVMKMLSAEVLDKLYPMLDDEWRLRMLSNLVFETPAAEHFLKLALNDDKASIVSQAIDVSAQDAELSSKFRELYADLALHHTDRSVRALAKLRHAAGVEVAIEFALNPKIPAQARIRANELLAKNIDHPAVISALLKLSLTSGIDDFYLNSLKGRPGLDAILRNVILRKNVTTAHEEAIKLLEDRLDNAENVAAVIKSLKRRPLIRALYYISRSETVYRMSAVKALSKLAAADLAVLEFLREVSLKDPDYFVRAEAAYYYFQGKNSPEAAKVLEKAIFLMGPARVTSTFAKLEGMAQDKAVLPTLLKIAKRTYRSARVDEPQIAAITLLKRHKAEPEVLRALRKLSRSPTLEIAEAAKAILDSPECESYLLP